MTKFVHFRSTSASGDCTFSGNKKGNIAVVDNVILLQHAEFLEDNYENSGFTNTNVSMPNGKIPIDVSSPIVIDDTEETSPFSRNASHNGSFHQNTTADISIISID